MLNAHVRTRAYAHTDSQAKYDFIIFDSMAEHEKYIYSTKIYIY